MISPHILFANDDVITQWVSTEVLTGAGFTVESACRGQQVLDLLRDAPDYDVLLIDAAMLEMAAGVEIGPLWRRLLPGQPVIYTGSPHDGLRLQLQRHESFLRAPFAPAALLHAIDLALEEARFRSVIPALLRPNHHVH